MTEEEKPQGQITPGPEDSIAKEPETTTWQQELRGKFFNRLEGLRGLEQGEKYIEDIKAKTENMSKKHKEAGFRSWENYKKEIVEIDTDEIEDEMGDDEEKWSSDFSGMILERKRTYLMYLNQARNRAGGIDDESSRRIDRILENEGWDKPEG